MSTRTSSLTSSVALVTVTGLVLVAFAPFAAARQQPGYPQAYPPDMSAQMPQQMPQQMYQPPQQAHPIRALFAGTIAAVIQGTGVGLAAGLAQGVTGALANWFNKGNRQGQYGAATQPYGQGYPTAPDPYAAAAPQTSYPATANAYPSAAGTYPATSAYPPNSAYPATSASPATPAYPATSAYPTTSPTAYPAAPIYPANPAYPSTTPSTVTAGNPTASPYGPAATPYPTNGAYPATSPDPYAAQNAGATAMPVAYTAPQVYDAHTGQPSSAAGTPYAMAAPASPGSLYAGVAYEVHAVGANGATTPINPSTYVFHTGDRFIVYYRPSLPGRMDVYNVNPTGQQTRIDTAEMAAGQLASLGPYEFSAATGDESLRIVLAPCSTPQLLVATRDIVNVAASAQPTSSVQLGNCGAPTARGVNIHTRDIKKVALDGSTSFALDPVSQQELASGQVTVREVSIVFHHR